MYAQEEEEKEEGPFDFSFDGILDMLDTIHHELLDCFCLAVEDHDDDAAEHIGAAVAAVDEAIEHFKRRQAKFDKRTY